MPSKESNWDYLRIVITMSSQRIKKSREDSCFIFVKKKKNTHNSALLTATHTTSEQRGSSGAQAEVPDWYFTGLGHGKEGRRLRGNATALTSSSGPSRPGY